MTEQPRKPKWWKFWRKAQYKRDFIAWRKQRLLIWAESTKGMEPVREISE